MELWSAFLIGLAGSLHCAGMCGPLMMALPVSSESTAGLISGRLLYNTGRIFTYVLLGLASGAFGSGASMIGFQQNMSVLLGAAILTYVAIPGSFKHKIAGYPIIRSYEEKLKGLISRVLKTNSSFSLFLLGLLNGLLPCGLVYAGLAGAAASAGLKEGMSYMALFGLGTLPVMFLISAAGHYITIGIRRKINRLIPVMAIVLGIIFILRGLDLGVPYLSPKLSTKVHTAKINSPRIESPAVKPAGIKHSMDDDCCK